MITMRVRKHHQPRGKHSERGDNDVDQWVKPRMHRLTFDVETLLESEGRRALLLRLKNNVAVGLVTVA
jgi:hypothetical protein